MQNKPSSIAIIGSGAWGTALAQVWAVAGNQVKIYSRHTNQADEINNKRVNEKYLPGIKLHENITATSDAASALQSCNIVVNVVPTQHISETLGALTPFIEKDAVIVNASKGIEITSRRLISKIIADILPEHEYAVLSGPTFAEEAAKGLPSAVTLASKIETMRLEQLAQQLSSKTFRPYVSHDVTGVEIAGAVKNIIAIACGMVDGCGFGNNSKAALMSRGLAEIKRLGIKLGAEAETFLGLSGMGDLALTCNSTQSRNYSLGLQLGHGNNIEQLMSNRSSVAEGYYTAQAVHLLAKDIGVEMPICEAVNEVLYNGGTVKKMAEDLLSRHLKIENH